jgi:hypothetical protein
MDDGTNFGSWEIEYDNMPWQQEMFKLAPEWYDPPNSATVYRQRVVFSIVKFPRNVFSTDVGKGRIVSDQTQTAKKPPRLY